MLVEWTDVKSGTGALINGAKSGDFDLIVALTEGLIADIALGSNLRLLSSYVDSPLVWAISVGCAQRHYNTIEDLKGATIAVSRFTSGSHLMTCVLAAQRGWRQDDVSFVVKGPFDALRRSVNDGSAAAFMWEQFMTKPFYDSGEVRRVGEIVTPWPCFLIAATTQTIDRRLEHIRALLRGLREACHVFHTDPGMPKEIAQHFGFQLEDATAWYSAVRITAAPTIASSSIDKTLAALREAAILPSTEPLKLAPADLIDPRLMSIRTDIATMKLYNRPELIVALHNNLRHAGLSRGPLSYSSLGRFDLNSYNPTAALDAMVELTSLQPHSRALNIGSNLGGPARYLAGRYGVDVTAVELQQELHLAASELTDRCAASLSGTVQHVGADANSLLPLLQSDAFEVVFALLTLLHFDQPARLPLFTHCHRVLQSNGHGRLYLEDWYATAPLTAEEREQLREQVFCRYLPSREEYLAHVTQAGFTLERVDDLTQPWTEWVTARRDRWVQGKSQHVQVHGEELYDRLLSFYELIVRLMQGGHVGGIRIIGKKTAQAGE